jgi:FixJ family two-component response regulator
MGTTVWVVDDDDAVRGVLEAMLKELGYTVTSYDKAEDALNAYRVQAPDVVVTDVRMPGMSGLELTRTMLEINDRCIVMILTGFPSIPDAVEAIRAGATDFLSKPVRMEELRVRMERAIENRMLQGRLSKVRVLALALILSLPIWFILGIVLARMLQR